MSWKQRFALLVTVVLGVVGCGTRGSGTAGADTRTVDPFTEVAVDGVIELEVTRGPKPAVFLRGDDNILPLIRTDVVGDRLTVKSTESIQLELPLQVTVTTPNLEAVMADGATKVRAQGLESDALRIELSGASKAELEGRVKHLTLELSGAGKVDAQQVDAEEVEVDLSGAGSVDLGAPQRLEAHVSGAGSVRYDGDPEVDQEVDGAGSVKKR